MFQGVLQPPNGEKENWGKSLEVEEKGINKSKREKNSENKGKSEGVMKVTSFCCCFQSKFEFWSLSLVAGTLDEKLRFAAQNNVGTNSFIRFHLSSFCLLLTVWIYGLLRFKFGCGFSDRFSPIVFKFYLDLGTVGSKIDWKLPCFLVFPCLDVCMCIYMCMCCLSHFDIIVDYPESNMGLF